MAFQFVKQCVPCFEALRVEREVHAASAQLLNELRVLFFHLTKACAKIFTSFDSLLHQVVLLDNLVLRGRQLSTNRVTEESVEVSVRSHHLSLISVVKATGEHSFGESNKVRRRGKVPELVHPESPSVADSSLYLINNHVDTKFSGEISNSLTELG